MVSVEIGGKVSDIDFRGKLIDLMAELGVSPEEYVCLLNGEVVTEFEDASPGDRVKFVKVWSGG